MSSDSRRTQRVASLIRAELARLLTEDISDPALVTVSINDVTLSKDLKIARIYFGLSPAPVIKEKDLKKGFDRAIPYMRKKLGENLKLRFVPSLVFEHDTHSDELSRLYHLMEDVQHGTDLEKAQ